MRAVVQRVSRAEVRVDGKSVGRIGGGLLVLLGIGRADTQQVARWLADKIAVLRVFDDAQGRMNRSVSDVGGAVLAVSQFTLYGDCRKGRRPSFDGAAEPEAARQIYEYFVNYLRELGLRVETGEFRAMMEVELVNDGPVTFMINTETH